MKRIKDALKFTVKVFFASLAINIFFAVIIVGIYAAQNLH